MQRAAALLCAALSFAAPPAFGQVVIGGSAGIVLRRVRRIWQVRPLPVWRIRPLRDRRSMGDGAGRAANSGRGALVLSVRPVLARGRGRVPLPGGAARSACARRTAGTEVPTRSAGLRRLPTAVEDIRPEYRGSSVVKEEYRESGRPVDGRQ